jgi:hypothetical protein
MSDLDGSRPRPDARHLHGRQAAAQAASSKILISDILQMRFGEGKMALQIPMLIWRAQILEDL